MVGKGLVHDRFNLGGVVDPESFSTKAFSVLDEVNAAEFDTRGALVFHFLPVKVSIYRTMSGSSQNYLLELDHVVGLV